MQKKTPLVAASAMVAAAAAIFGVSAYWPEIMALRSAKPVEHVATPAPETLAKPDEQPTVVEAPAVPEPAQQVAAPPPAETPAPAASVAEQLAPPPVPAGPVVPTFDTVRVEPTGEAVVAGRAAPGAQVVLKFADVVVAEVTAEADGSFVFVPEHPLPQGSGALTLESRADGETLVSTDAVAVVVSRKAPALVAKINPKAATKLVQAPSKVVSSAPPRDVRFSTIDYNDKGDMIFQGVATPNSTVRLYVDNDISGEVTVDDKGNWRFDAVAPIEPGEHRLRADEVNAEGKVTSRAETPFLREKPEVVLAAQAQVPPAELAEPGTSTTMMPVEEGLLVAASGNAETTAAPVTAEAKSRVAVAPAVVPGGPMRVVIQPGNNLWIVSQEIYGEGKSYALIFEANRDQIKDADKIYPGQILAAPVASN